MTTIAIKTSPAGKEAQRVVELDPDGGLGYFQLGRHFVFVNRPSDAEETVRRAAEHKIEHPLLPLLRFDLAFIKGDDATQRTFLPFVRLSR